MSDRQNDVLAAIDGALDDWTVSGDAMRWQPPQESTESRTSDAEKSLLQFGQAWANMTRNLYGAVGGAFAHMRVGDQVRITTPDGVTSHSIITNANEDGSFDLEPEATDARSTT